MQDVNRDVLFFLSLKSSCANFSMCKQSLQINLEILVLLKYPHRVLHCRDVFFLGKLPLLL